MPAIVTCRDKCCEQHWNVGSDDFVVPGVIAVVVGLFNFSLISSALIALYFTPSDFSDLCPNVTYSPLLYVPLFSLAAVEVCFILNEGLIIIVSAQGPIFKQTKSFLFRQKFMPHLIYLRIFLAVLELLAITASVVGLFHPAAVSTLKDCDDLRSRLAFARGVVFFQIVCYALFLVKVCLYTDPLGCFTPGLLERMTLLDDSDGRGSLLLSPSENFKREDYKTVASRRRAVSVDHSSAATEIMVRRKSRVLSLSMNDVERATKVHTDTINRQKYERRLRALFCCLGIKGQKARGVALEDVARGLYTVFSETDTILSDVIAGFSLLREHQLQKMKRGGELALTTKFRMVTFQMMPPAQRCLADPGRLREDYPFDFTLVENQLLFEDMVHYMHYAMGVYGWPLHVFDNLCCGVCQLCTVTCCRFRCMHKRVRMKEFNEDNCCMCGVGTFRLRTKIAESEILYVSFQNKIYLAPFIVCLDHNMKSVVICVRGTLSLKDTLTDMSFSPIGRTVEGVKETFIHGGMYRAALGILNTIRKKEVVMKAFETYKGYRLILTGHSLGAGVASILALLMKQEMKLSDEMMHCYAFSPPGALFSFPLAEYSKSFITSVVLGNDIVPRLSMRALLHLKFTVKHLLDNSDIPKYKILCKSRTCATLCQCFDKSRELVRDTASTIRRSSMGSSDQSSRRGVARNGLGRGDSVATQESRYKDVLATGAGMDSVGTSVAGLEDVTITMERGGEEVTRGVNRVVSDGGAEHQRGGPHLKRDESVEWQVYEKPSTASIRQRLFEKAVSIQADSLPGPHSSAPPILSRLRSHTPHARQNSIPHSLAAQLKQAVSLDLNSEDPFEQLIQGTEDIPLSVSSTPDLNLPSPPELHPQHGNALATRTPIKADPVGVASSSGKKRSRKGSDALIMDNAMPVIGAECRVDESETFTPFFPPGRIVHLQVRKTHRCGQDELEVVEVNRENMCVILIDNGVVDDHLPNHVLSALKSCKTSLMNSPRTYDREAIRDMREKREQLLSGIRVLKLAHENSSEGNKFFVGGSPMGNPPGQLGKGVKRYRLQKQGSFDGIPMSNLLSSTTADGPGLEVPHHRTTALSRISECTDEDDARSVDLVVANCRGTVSVTADVLEGSEVTGGSEYVDGETRLDSKTKHQGTSTGSKVSSQSSETSLPLGCSIDSPISSHPPTPASADRDDVFTPGGELGGSSKPREGLTLALRLEGGSTDSVASAGSNKLLARRNVTIDKLKFDTSTNKMPNN